MYCILYLERFFPVIRLLAPYRDVRNKILAGQPSQAERNSVCYQLLVKRLLQ